MLTAQYVSVWIGDDFTRECLAIEVGTSFVAARVMSGLDRHGTCPYGLVNENGAPEYLKSDNGSEFIAHILPVRAEFKEKWSVRIRTPRSLTFGLD